MGSDKQLYNKGARKIQVAGGDLRPGETMSLPAAIADRLLSLYPLELQSVGGGVSEKVVEKESTPVDEAPADKAEVLSEKEFKALAKKAKKAGFESVDGYLASQSEDTDEG